MHTEEEFLRAKKRVKAKKSFYQHLMSYAIVNLFLLVLNLLTSPGTLWFVYPLLGWGVGLAFHYVEVFGIPGFDILSKEWEEKELERELRQFRQQMPSPKSAKHPSTPKDKGLELKELRDNYDESDFV
ncbi:MAG: 2TM domain-containing protein [Saprospiraceae bacterium]|nr:2TM domain-containing protein [Saprospiraceae bacterium]MCF8248398.1 2TM domain-containing protein [Saprospiraceae bacterium]MCF8280069.1 2TM domain-containing protein [Bacteroidales bacterium]MCF8309926.1 2TM domain-containing protein [Saprospiraceae bacterium]MCF8438743.1 2TM domain-containing protein [Saprospiraceae bacterium]